MVSTYQTSLTGMAPPLVVTGEPSDFTMANETLPRPKSTSRIKLVNLTHPWENPGLPVPNRVRSRVITAANAQQSSTFHLGCPGDGGMQPQRLRNGPWISGLRDERLHSAVGGRPPTGCSAPPRHREIR